MLYKPLISKASSPLPHLSLGPDLGSQSGRTAALVINQAASVNVSRQVFPFRLP